MKYLVLIFTVTAAFGQSNETLKVRSFVSGNQHAIMTEFVDFLSIPNVANDSANIRKNAAFIMNMMEKRGIKNVQLLSGNKNDFPPAVYGEVLVPGAKQTLIFYAHYDGQPVNPAQWATGLSPFEPKLFTGKFDDGQPRQFPEKGQAFDANWRIYGRGASDDKAGVSVILNAYEAIAKNKLKLNHNLKFFFEGEEEAGSPHLDQLLAKYESLLKSDLWVICDGPVHQTGKKIISFGVRGDAHVNITVYGPKRPLHSGHYGNWAPNPAMMLVELLASMKDDNGMVTIKDFYDDVKPFSEVELQALREMPDIDEQMKQELGLRSTEMKGKKLTEAITLPSLNINGIQSANVGKMASNVIPVVADAVLDLRLVVGNDWRRQQQKVIDHIRAQGYTVIDHDPTDQERMQADKLAKVIAVENGYNAQRTPMNLPIAQKVIGAVKSTTTDQVVLLPGSGGSLPLYLFEQFLDANTISVPIANHDNNQHAENENIRVSNFFTGIETIAAVMSMK